MLQLNPMIPIVRVSDNAKGFAMVLIDYSQEHDLLWVCAINDGTIWTLPNQEIRMDTNISLRRFMTKGEPETEPKPIPTEK